METNSDTATITVPVGNVNDNSPLILAQTAELSEKATAGTEVVDLADDNTKSDTDLDGDAIQYSIQKINGKAYTGDLFSINQSTGAITLKAGAGLEYDRIDEYILDITASDGKNESSVKVTVNIQDSNTKPTAVNDFAHSMRMPASAQTKRPALSMPMTPTQMVMH